MSKFEGKILSQKLLHEALEHLEIVCDHADEDCPSEYRSKHFNPSIQDARAFIDEVTKEDSDGEVN
jgi:hypothetical protein